MVDDITKQRLRGLLANVGAVTEKLRAGDAHVIAAVTQVLGGMDDTDVVDRARDLGRLFNNLPIVEQSRLRSASAAWLGIRTA